MSMEEQKKKVVKIVAIRGRDDIADLDEIIEKVDLKQICCISLDRKEYLSGIDVFEQADDFSSQLKLIANPIRLKILLILLNKEWACNCEFESAFNEHQTLISHHLRNLREGGLITFQKKGQWKFYKIPDEIRPFLEKVRDLIYILPKKCC
ncbi:MAG: ArsR/SmtB family transcription factor [Candidatus Heimdallarchaeota archaeon]